MEEIFEFEDSSLTDEKAEIDPSTVKLMIQKDDTFNEEKLIEWAINNLENLDVRETII